MKTLQGMFAQPLSAYIKLLDSLGYRLQDPAFILTAFERLYPLRLGFDPSQMQMPSARIRCVIPWRWDCFNLEWILLPFNPGLVMLLSEPHNNIWR
jgi:hypothetical protein